MRPFRLLPSCAAALAAACFVDAHAEIRLVQPGGSALPEGAATKAFNPKTGGWDVTLHQLFNFGGTTEYQIIGTGGEVIDNVFIDVDGPPAGSPLFVKVLSDAPLGLRSVMNIEQLGTAETFVLNVNASEDVGRITAEVIGEVICGRDVLGPIISTTADNATRGITWVQAGRDILGDLKAENGRIGLAYGMRNIGSALQPVSIHAKHKITQVSAFDIHADINSRVNGGTGGIWAFTCSRFFGTVTTERFYFNTSNGLDAIVKINQQFTGRINIGKSHTSATEEFIVPTNGLSGQIIVNYDAVPGGTWTAPIRVGANGTPGQIILVGPRYPQTNTAIGGGAVGLVPFRLHDQACSPVNGQTVQAAVGTSPSVKLRHYGPVTWQVGFGSPVSIERRLLGSTGAYSPAPASDFLVTFNPIDPNVVNVSAAAGKPGFAPGFQYRIRPSVNLKCAVPAAPSVTWDSDYLLSVQTAAASCQGDTDGNGIVNVSDLLAVISAWGSTQPGIAADVTHDNIVNVNDLLTVINRWGSC